MSKRRTNKWRKGEALTATKLNRRIGVSRDAKPFRRVIVVSRFGEDTEELGEVKVPPSPDLSSYGLFSTTWYDTILGREFVYVRDIQYEVGKGEPYRAYLPPEYIPSYVDINDEGIEAIVFYSGDSNLWEVTIMGIVPKEYQYSVPRLSTRTPTCHWADYECYRTTPTGRAEITLIGCQYPIEFQYGTEIAPTSSYGWLGKFVHNISIRSSNYLGNVTPLWFADLHRSLGIEAIYYGDLGFGGLGWDKSLAHVGVIAGQNRWERAVQTVEHVDSPVNLVLTEDDDYGLKLYAYDTLSATVVSPVYVPASKHASYRTILGSQLRLSAELSTEDDVAFSREWDTGTFWAFYIGGGWRVTSLGECWGMKIGFGSVANSVYQLAVQEWLDDSLEQINARASSARLISGLYPIEAQRSFRIAWTGGLGSVDFSLTTEDTGVVHTLPELQLLYPDGIPLSGYIYADPPIPITALGLVQEITT